MRCFILKFWTHVTEAENKVCDKPMLLRACKAHFFKSESWMAIHFRMHFWTFRVHIQKFSVISLFYCRFLQPAIHSHLASCFMLVNFLNLCATVLNFLWCFFPDFQNLIAFRLYSKSTGIEKFLHSLSTSCKFCSLSLISASSSTDSWIRHHTFFFEVQAFISVDE